MKCGGRGATCPNEPKFTFNGGAFASSDGKARRCTACNECMAQIRLLASRQRVSDQALDVRNLDALVAPQ